MVMQPAEMRDLNDRAAGWRLLGAWEGRVLVQGEVRTPFVVIGQEVSEDASKGTFIPHDHVIETLAPQGPDQALHIRILPRGEGRDHELLATETLQEATEVESLAAVSIPHEILRRCFVWKSFADLLLHREAA